MRLRYLALLILLIVALGLFFVGYCIHDPNLGYMLQLFSVIVFLFFVIGVLETLGKILREWWATRRRK